MKSIRIAIGNNNGWVEKVATDSLSRFSDNNYYLYIFFQKIYKEKFVLNSIIFSLQRKELNMIINTF